MVEVTDLAELQRRALDWAQQGVDAGWLSTRDRASIAAVEDRSPDMLFESGIGRPLVAAFFGGTGVGKSSLLNRLAGQAIASTGAVRPTSREITVYLHESVRIRAVDSELLLDKVRVIHHANEGHRSVLWVDMPDFDSTDAANHELALQWLPHIDVVIYVVSPERYRDDRGWRLLLEHELEHAWLFVFNQWDRGHAVQIEDFTRLLVQAGFEDPVVLRTDARAERSPLRPDDFEQLGRSIRELAEQKAMEQLTQHNRLARSRVLGEAVGMLIRKLGGKDDFPRLRDVWHGIWADTSLKLRRGLQWPVQEVAARFVQREGNLLQRSLDLGKPAQPQRSDSLESPVISLIWDEWAQLCFEDALDRLLIECENLGVPSSPLAQSLRGLRTKASRLLLDHAQTALRESLARPGNFGQRALLRLSGLITVVAPLIALGWVSYEVVAEYYQSVHEETPFLGTDFAIHSSLLVVVAWLLPYFVHRKLRPSTERTARLGLQAGIRSALDELEATVAACLQSFSEAAATLRASGEAIVSEIRSPIASEPAVVSPQTNLRRLLAAEGPHRAEEKNTAGFGR